MSSSRSLQRLGDSVFATVDKINLELFTLTYGALVTQLLSDTDDVVQVNGMLERMGYDIGLRIIDEFLSKSGTRRCKSWAETADTIALVGFKMYLGVAASSSKVTDKKFSIILEDNPLIGFVELPEEYRDTLVYSNILCGVIRGALNMLQLEVKAKIKQCPLRGDNVTEIRVALLENVSGELPAGEKPIIRDE
eukprot:TRINITY_DN12556_c0_g1_i1.p1 TRINITY_DN12556_c0_g1~~TRINITY_DN12556_c0_g1_i1.p1  ORF type:complete len:193 (-),score=37.59 TRINITY_DN12556_c0_g1_i1:31-609(-)